MEDNRTLVELEGVNGSWFTLSGPGMGEQGVILGTDLEGIFDAPVKTIWTEHAHQIGGTYAGTRYLKRDIVFGVWIDDIDSGSWQFNDSEWRKAWAYDQDCKLWITTPDSGRRYLKVRLLEQPSFKPEKDPNLIKSARVIMTVCAGDPWWYDEEGYTDTWVLESGTSGSGTVTIDNPTDQPVWAEWVLQGAARWTIPDFSFGDNSFGRAEADKERRIKMPAQKPGQTFLITTDPHEDMLRDPAGTQVWSLMNGVTFNYPIPPYTKAIQLPVSVEGAAPGVGVQVRIKRNWSRPWGLE
ncbi:phage tail protein [Nocardia sp. NPDC127526]|uniref:phage tail protein n=1 Tax=Nocardia sp. NPDC127526 TaxID=3345393 RepID=UPI00363DDA99